MFSYIVKRSLGILLNLLLVSFFIFFILQWVPGDIAAEVLGDNSTDEQYAAFRELHNLNDSWSSAMPAGLATPSRATLVRL